MVALPQGPYQDCIAGVAKLDCAGFLYSANAGEAGTSEPWLRRGHGGHSTASTVLPMNFRPSGTRWPLRGDQGSRRKPVGPKPIP